MSPLRSRPAQQAKPLHTDIKVPPAVELAIMAAVQRGNNGKPATPEQKLKALAWVKNAAITMSMFNLVVAGQMDMVIDEKVVEPGFRMSASERARRDQQAATP